MNQRLSLPLSSITVPDRFRTDYGDLDLLKSSISHYGLLQPIVINQANVLISGGRRYRAHVELNMERIDVSYYETLSEGQRLELEALENIVRKNFSWTEECLAVYKIHNQRKREAALDKDKEWNTRLASELFGKSKGALDYTIIIARKLEAELKLPEGKRPYHAYSSLNEAYRVGYLGEQETLALAILAKKSATVNIPRETIDVMDQLVSETKDLASKPDLLEEKRKQYESNPHNKGSFEEYWKQRQELVQQHEQTIYLSNRLNHVNCITFMNESSTPHYDHIITDIPYGIDMEMLNQNNVHGGLSNLDRVKEEHDVEENMSLMEQFFPAAFKCTRDKAFLITYCDVMQWHFMYDLATNAGWNVQRWPFIWHKTQAMNQCASYNSTKNYEILMLCRKPGATLITQLPTSIINASAETAKADTGHPFSKPYSITQLLADAVSIKGQTFLEPFAGRGSIALELTRQERNVICCEKQDDHYNALLENFKHYYLGLNPNSLFK